MKRYMLIILLVLLLAWLMWQLPGAHAQGPVPTPPPTEQPITQGDVDALQKQANAASANLQGARVGLAQAQANYNAAANYAAQARALADQAEQQLKLQQTAEAVALATQARERADQADREADAAAAILKDAQDQIDLAQARVDELTAALLSAHATIKQRDATIVDQDRTIDSQNREIEAYRQYREQTNTLIILLAFDLVIAAIVALVIVRQLQTSKRIRYEAIPAITTAQPRDEPTEIPNSEAVAQQLDSLARQRTVAP